MQQPKHSGKFQALMLSAATSTDIINSPSPLISTGRDWLAGLGLPPPGFTASSSRLATPCTTPNKIMMQEDARDENQAEGSAWEPDEAAAFVADGAGLPENAKRIVPARWDEDEEEGEEETAVELGGVGGRNDVWFDSVALDANEKEADAAGIGGTSFAAGGGMVTHDEEVPPISMDASDEATAIGDLLLPPSAQADTAAIAMAQRAVAAFFSQPDVPLLPTPAPRAPAPPQPPRRSDRLADKPQLPAVDKARNVLYTKLGIKVQEMPLSKATKEFAGSCKSTMSDSAVAAVGTLLKLNLPSVITADEALIAMAGAGGTELAVNAIDASA